MQTRTARDNQGVRSSQPGESVFRVPDFFLRSYMAEVFSASVRKSRVDTALLVKTTQELLWLFVVV